MTVNRAGLMGKVGAVFLMLLASAAMTAFARPLPPQQAFRFHAALVHQALEVRWTAAPGYHIYRSRVHLSVSPRSVRLAPFRLPKGRWVNDPAFGRQAVYEGRTDLTIPLLSAPAGRPIEVIARYQGCANAGICYPPLQKTVVLTAPTITQPTPSALVSATPLASASQPPWASLFVFLLAGLGLAFTPCVFPMIPILSATVVGQQGGRARPFTLSCAYVLGMAVTYTAAGVVAALTGHYLQAAFQNPWVLTGFSGLFVVLALSLFGLYDLQVPSVVSERLARYGRGGQLTGTFVLGAFSALIVGPCVAAPLAGALLLISRTGDAVFGGFALLALSLGMGLPLMVIGTSAGHLLPKAGPWLSKTRGVFAILLLGVAVWLESRILAPSVVLALWSLLVMISSVALGALEPLPLGAGGLARAAKGIGVAFLAYGLLLGVGALSGATSPLAPLSAFVPQPRPGPRMGRDALHFHRIHTLRGLKAVFADARGRPVMVDFWASWCVQCQRMDVNTFENKRVMKALAPFVLVRADVSRSSRASRQLLARLHSFGPPTLVFLGAHGQLLRNLPGYEGPAAFLAQVRAVSSGTSSPAPVATGAS